MAYIGRTPHSGSYEKQLITGDSSTTTFSLDFSVGNNASLIVSTNGTILEPDVGYSLSGGGSNIVFSTAPQTGHRTYIVFLGIARDVDYLDSVGIITTRTELAAAAATDDLLLLYDTSAGALRKIQRSNLSDVVVDVTPQLGGNLDTNEKEINTVSNRNVLIAPNGTGKLEVKGNTNAGTIQLNCESNSHGVKIKGPPHSAGQSYTLTLPSSITSGYYLKTDGSGNLSFAEVPSPTVPTVANVSQTITPASATSINITGTNFSGIPIVQFIKSDTGAITSSNTVSLTNATTLAVNVTLALGSYYVRIELENGRAVRSTNAIISASTAPTFSTSAGSLGSFAGNFSGTLATISASSDSTIAFAETTSVLAGAGVTLNTSTGALTTSDFGGSSTTPTTYTFTLRITDAESQTTTREFSFNSTFGATAGAQFN